MASKPRRDALSDLIAERPHRIVGAVHVAAGHRQALVSQEIAHKEGVGAGLPGVGPNCVPQIMQAHVIKLGGGSDLLPSILDSGLRERPFCIGGREYPWRFL